MSDNWDFYFTSINDESASIRVDLDATAGISLDDFPRRVEIVIYFASVTESGMPEDEEWEALHELDDALMTWAEQSESDVPVASITQSGRRSYVIYTSRTEPAVGEIEKLLASVGGRRCEIALDDDPEWRFYQEVLLPTPVEMQWMTDRALVEHLREAGDAVEIPREVDHMAYFRTEDGRSRFLAEATSRGYELGDEGDADEGETNESDGNEEDEYPYAAALKRTHAVDLDTAFQHSGELCELALDHDGIYDGWGCMIVES